MISAASFISIKVIDEGPVTLRSTPRAPSIDASSKLLESAFKAASRARLSPLAEPIPINAEPAFCNVILTSAKSVLIKPGLVINSEIPETPLYRTSSARANASITVSRASTTDKRRSFGTTIKVSTFSLSLAIPASACTARRRPSNENGRVTMPMVSAPAALAISATTGAAPVPVPPPSPAAMKTMSAPLSASSISSRWASAA